MQRLLCPIATIKQAQASKKVALNTDYRFKNLKTFKKDLGLSSSKKNQFTQLSFSSDLFISQLEESTKESTKGVFTH